MDLILETAVKPAFSSPFLNSFFKGIAVAGKFFQSHYSQYGFRVACACLAGTLPAYFLNSYGFFIEYRGFWVTITILISLSPTAGASIDGLIQRCLGTLIGALLAMAVWYIVDQRIPGIIVLSFFIAAYRILSFIKPDLRLLSSGTRFPAGDSFISYVDNSFVLS